MYDLKWDKTFGVLMGIKSRLFPEQSAPGTVEDYLLVQASLLGKEISQILSDSSNWK